MPTAHCTRCGQVTGDSHGSPMTCGPCLAGRLENNRRFMSPSGVPMVRCLRCSTPVRDYKYNGGYCGNCYILTMSPSKAAPGKIVDVEAPLGKWPKWQLGASYDNTVAATAAQFQQFKYQQQQLLAAQKESLEKTFGLSLSHLMPNDGTAPSPKPAPKPQKPAEKPYKTYSVDMLAIEMQFLGQNAAKVPKVVKHRNEPVEPAKPKPALVPTFSGRKFRDI